MSLSGLGQVLQQGSFVAGLFAGGVSSRRQIIMTCEGERFVIPVTPATYKVSSGQQNKIVDIEQLGEALIFGTPKARHLSWEMFFPQQEHDYPFVVGDDKAPAECVELITKWKELKKPVRVIITDTPVNMAMGIMTFDYHEQDGSHDIYYSIELAEYKELTIPMANNDKQTETPSGLKKRATTASKRAEQIKKAMDTAKKAKNVLDTAKRAYGTYRQYQRLVQSNNLKSFIFNSPAIIRKLKIPKLPGDITKRW